MTSEEKEELREILQGGIADGLMRLNHARNIAGRIADNDVINNMDVSLAAFANAEIKIKRLLGIA